MAMPERVREVGKAQEIPEQYQYEPQKWLWRSFHPYAPFTGDAYDWASWVYDDATTYEGTVRTNIPHGKGVMQMGLMGNGGGILDTKVGDVYEGEFHTGWAHGIGQYVSADGLIYKGEYSGGQKDGCGALYDLKPWKDLIAEGKKPGKAWRMARAQIADSATYGTWRNDTFVSEPTENGAFCSLGDIQKTLVSTDIVAGGARMFSFKPEGQATLHKMLLPESEAPAPVMQHPLHYPHGTLFMAPGPAGQTAGIPNSIPLKKMMKREANNYMRIHERYNFDYVPASNSLMAKAMRWYGKIEKMQQREEELEQRRADRRLKKIQSEGGGADATYEPLPAVLGKEDEDDDTGDVDESDLVADATEFIARRNHSGPSHALPGIGPTAFGSITLSMSRTRQGLGNFLEHISKRAPPMPRWGSKPGQS